MLKEKKDWAEYDKWLNSLDVMKKLSKRAKVRIIKALNDAKFELARCEHEDAWMMMGRLAAIEKDVEYIGVRKPKKKIAKKIRPGGYFLGVKKL